jgi:hypothetical protein
MTGHTEATAIAQVIPVSQDPERFVSRRAFWCRWAADRAIAGPVCCACQRVLQWKVCGVSHEGEPLLHTQCVPAGR